VLRAPRKGALRQKKRGHHVGNRFASWRYGDVLSLSKNLERKTVHAELSNQRRAVANIHGLLRVHATMGGANGANIRIGWHYTYVRTNAAPGDCGCINMQGGSGWASYNFNRSFGIVGEVAAQHASNIAPFSTDLTLTSFLAGVRYKSKPAAAFVAFVQFLLGGAHATGDLAPGARGWHPRLCQCVCADHRR
jgi:hypothetical protein